MDVNNPMCGKSNILLSMIQWLWWIVYEIYINDLSLKRYVTGYLISCMEYLTNSNDR